MEFVEAVHGRAPPAPPRERRWASSLALFRQTFSLSLSLLFFGHKVFIAYKTEPVGVLGVAQWKTSAAARRSSRLVPSTGPLHYPPRGLKKLF